jgi:hypothetical protein
MKKISNYIIEKLRISKDDIQLKYFPKTKRELVRCIDKEISEHGYKCNLNCIDTSEITDMERLFDASENGCCTLTYDTNNKFYEFNGDISLWDVRKVKTMAMMFQFSKFNGDISKWDVSNVDDMYAMFRDSEFIKQNNKSTDNWNIKDTCDIEEMKDVL